MKIWIEAILMLAGGALVVTGRSLESITVGGLMLAAAVFMTLLVSAKAIDATDVDRDQLIRG